MKGYNENFFLQVCRICLFCFQTKIFPWHIFLSRKSLLFDILIVFQKTNNFEGQKNVLIFFWLLDNFFFSFWSQSYTGCEVNSRRSLNKCNFNNFDASKTNLIFLETTYFVDFRSDVKMLSSIFLWRENNLILNLIFSIGFTLR